MELVDKVVSWFKKNPSVDAKDMMEFRQEKVELVKSEISDIIDQIDRNSEAHQVMMETTDKSIEKGMDGGDSLKQHLISKHTKTRDNLLKSLGGKKNELRRHEAAMEILVDELEKGERAKEYADCIVRDDKGNILMLLRRYDSSFEPNKWGLPGGHIDPGELAKDAAIRELKEEANLTAIDCSKAAYITLPEGGSICIYDVLVEEDDSMVALDDEEHMNYAWMSVNEIKKRPEADFIIGLKESLLRIVDPMYAHFLVIRKAHDSGEIDDDTFNKAIATEKKFGFAKEQE